LPHIVGICLNALCLDVWTLWRDVSANQWRCREEASTGNGAARTLRTRDCAAQRVGGEHGARHAGELWVASTEHGTLGSLWVVSTAHGTSRNSWVESMVYGTLGSSWGENTAHGTSGSSLVESTVHGTSGSSWEESTVHGTSGSSWVDRRRC